MQKGKRKGKNIKQKSKKIQVEGYKQNQNTTTYRKIGTYVMDKMMKRKQRRVGEGPDHFEGKKQMAYKIYIQF